MTVVWSLPPNASPISGREWVVNSFDKAIATCLGLAIDLFRRLDKISATLILSIFSDRFLNIL